MKADMQTKIFVCLLAALLPALLVHTGCAGYGSARYHRQIQGKLPEMMNNFKDYHLYYSGMSEAFPSGLIFDPKNDDKTVAQKKWIKVKNRDLAEKIVRNLERYTHYPPELYILTGENGQTYGYIYTGYLHIVVRQIEENKIHVYEMHQAPHLKYDSNGFFSGFHR